MSCVYSRTIRSARFGNQGETNVSKASVTPQETTNQDAPDMGADGGDLACPGSSVVADLLGEGEKR